MKKDQSKNGAAEIEETDAAEQESNVGTLEQEASEQDQPEQNDGRTPREGYAKCLFGSGDDAGMVVVKDGGMVVAEIDDVLIQIPVTREAIEASCEKYTTEITDADGVVHRLSGMDAAVVSKYLHAMESLRGEIRTDAKKDRLQTDEYYRNRFWNFVSFGGGTRSGRKVEPVKADALEGLSAAEIIAYMKKQGLVS